MPVDGFLQEDIDVAGKEEPSRSVAASAALSALPVPSRKRPKQRLIFTATTGYTGTDYFSTLLAAASVPILSLHEPKDFKVGFPHAFLFGLNETYAKRRSLKVGRFLQDIRNMTQDLGPDAVYAEISHMFVKSWGDVMLDWIESVDPQHERYDVTIIILRRYLGRMTKSFLSKHSVWDPTRALGDWHDTEYTLHHKEALLPPLHPFHGADSIDLILGYLADMELRIQRFQARYAWVHYVEARSEEIFSPGGALRLLSELELDEPPPDPAALAKLRRKNSHVSKAPALELISEDYFFARSVLFEERYRVAGIPFPVMSQKRRIAPCEGNAEDSPLPWCLSNLPLMTVEEARAIVSSITQDIPKNNPACSKSFIKAHQAEDARIMKEHERTHRINSKKLDKRWPIPTILD